mgnify:CR=1 FL=1
MKYYSTNKQALLASLEEAVVKGLAGDKGLYMPEHIRPLDKDTISKTNHSMKSPVRQHRLSSGKI